MTLIRCLIFCLFVFSTAKAEPPKRTFEPVEGSMSFPVSQNLVVSALKIQPEIDAASASLKGLTAEGNVVIKAKPTDSSDWITVACDKATYDLANDRIVLTGWPAVKSGAQLLRATNEKTYVVISRKDGKWEIKGDHKMELNLGALRKKAG